MDPLNKLPPELQVHILVLLRCRRSILRFAQASSVILRQYLTSKPYITRKLIALDFDDEMIQDAMAIILLPSPHDFGDYSAILHQHQCTWSAQQFPNPLKTGDDSLMDPLRTLQDRLLFFIADYLTKATADFPPREYLCLPDFSRSRLMFKDEEVSPVFDLAELTDEERKRLLRAFLRYELLCSMCHCRSSYGMGLWERQCLYEYKGRMFRPWEREAIRCVQKYLASLYAAMFAQCSDSWLPDAPMGPLSSHTTRLLYPDTLYVDAHAYASDMGLKAEEISLAASMAGFGFDLVTALVRSATDGQLGRDRLECWLRDLFRKGKQAFPTLIQHSDHLYLGGRDQKWKYADEAPGMYKLLHTRLSGDSSLHTSIYQQRAWTFFDDNRFYPSSGGVWPHFPMLDELGEPLGDTAEYEEWFSDPKRARALRRSKKWHDEQRGKVGGDEPVKGSKNIEMEMECEALLPITTEKDWVRKLPRFWW